MGEEGMIVKKAYVVDVFETGLGMVTLPTMGPRPNAIIFL